MDTENKWVLSRGLRDHKKGEWLLLSMGFLWGGSWKIPELDGRFDSFTTLYYTKATELRTLKWVNFYRR